MQNEWNENENQYLTNYIYIRELYLANSEPYYQNSGLYKSGGKISSPFFKNLYTKNY